MPILVAVSPIAPDRQIAAIAKVAAFFLIWLAVWLPIAIPLSIWLKWRPPQPLTVAQKLPLLASLYAIAPLILWGAATVEGKSFAEYGLPWNSIVLESLGRGMILGVLGLGGMLAIESGLGWVSWQLPLPPPSQLATTLLLGLWVGLTEELIFRGFLQTQLQQDYSVWVAAAIGSTIFALLHLIWEGRNNVPQLPGLWLMGMVLVLARAVDGGLGLAWGLHAGWIWTIASLDSTLVYPKPRLAWLTGLDGKPLAGIAGILFLMATAALLWYFQKLMQV